MRARQCPALTPLRSRQTTDDCFPGRPEEASRDGLTVFFVADAVRWATSETDPDGPIEVVFEANGVIRGGIKQGLTGAIRVGDLIRVLPLGIGPDEQLGYPMLTFYLTAAELLQAAEVIVGIAPRGRSVAAPHESSSLGVAGSDTPKTDDQAQFAGVAP